MGTFRHIAALWLVPAKGGRHSGNAIMAWLHGQKDRAVRAFFLTFGLLCFATGLQAQMLLQTAQDRALLAQVIADEKPEFAPPNGVTGITVPHHLLAADLIARGFWAASAGAYDRIILLSPDHFRQVPERFAVVTQTMPTVFGPVAPDNAAMTTLRQNPALFAPHPDPETEHGIAALTPFIAHFFPDVPVLSIVASIHSRPKDWAQAADALRPLITPRTLVIQSTDYSHYLPVGAAAQYDQQSLGVILSGAMQKVASLNQPDHLDSKAAQYLQMSLQSTQGSAPVVSANRNSTQYGGDAQSTTSYIVTAYLRDPAEAAKMDYSDQARVVFGGDVLTSRYLAPVLNDPDALADILQTSHRHTGGAPLAINFEGVLTAQHVANAPFDSHLAPARLSLPVLRNLGVTAAGLANNHSADFGAQGLAVTASILQQAGITPLHPGEIADLGPLRVVALNLLRARTPDARAALRDRLCQDPAGAPVVAFVHWGKEYTDTPTEVERALADDFAACGFAALIGAHSHRADPVLRIAAGRMPWNFSLGNFLFDQNARRATGQLAELRIFQQGTVAMRLIPLPNLFELGRAR